MTKKEPKLYTYRVDGYGDFPLDMLRYDRAWPASERDSAVAQGVPGERNRRIVVINSYQAPTPARWASFNWYVTHDS